MNQSSEHERNVLRILLFASLIFSLNLLYIDLRLLGVVGSDRNVLGKSTDTASACPAACVTEIKKQVNASKTTSSATSGSVKESFIPIGTGSVTSDEWTDVPGLQVIIDTAQYGTIKEVTWDASVHSDANQIVQVRLYNATDKHPVWYSDFTFNNSIVAGSQTSPKITLDAGNKAYIVQMKTQLKYQATLDFSRIRIVYR